MGLMASHHQLSSAEIAAHQAATGLSTEQLDQLHMRFLALDRRQLGYLTPTDLLCIPQLSQNPMHRQLIDGFFATPSERIDFDQFVRTCATFLVPQFGQVRQQQRADGRGQKLRLLSQMFDTQRCGRIKCTDFQRTMKYLLDSVPPSDGVTNVPHPMGSETELQQLEELAFGGSDSISYEQFEQRLSTADVEAALAVRKWLEEPDENNKITK